MNNATGLWEDLALVRAKILFLWHLFLLCPHSVFQQGNKKGPLGRWDFDTQEEYSEYMNNKEALPKWVGTKYGQGVRRGVMMEWASLHQVWGWSGWDIPKQVL